jgi:penicillin-binding protein 2
VSLEPSIFFDEVNERQGVFHRRTFILSGFAGLGVLTLVGRLTDLQVVEAGRYQSLSNSNQFNFRLRPPPRGRILDRNGVELASNRPNFRVLFRKGEAKSAKGEAGHIESTLDKVASLIPIPDPKRAALLREIVNTPKSAPVALANDLSWDEFTRINVRAPELPGVAADMSEARVYPFGGAFAHVIGYVARISAEDVEREKGPDGKPDRLLLDPGFRIGKQGVEKALDHQLRGVPGGQKVEVDSVGRVIREDPAGDIHAIPGRDVVLTLDADIQNRALQVFGEDSGGAVMMDVRTGDVLCMLSAPSFDANQFVSGISASEYRALADYERKPLLDKALTGTYPPGSTFKTMVALTALENGFDPKRTFTCNGVFAFGNHVFTCDKHHGTLDLHQAIVTSCDVYFYQAALFCGPDKIAEIARHFGLGQIFDIGIPGQKAGVVPDQAWKAKRFAKQGKEAQRWWPGETPSMGIGQGYTNINALQSCVMVARLANGKKALRPRLIRSIGGIEQPRGSAVDDLPVNPDHLAFVRAAMADVVAATVANATGAQARLGLDPIMMAGKTGTAQSHTGKTAHGAQGAWALRDHAWFVAFAPADDPRYALSVIVEHGGFGGEAAAPKAREIMRVALLKDPEVRARIERPMPLPHVDPNAPLEGAAPPPPTDIPGAPQQGPSGQQLQNPVVPDQPT